MNTKDIAEQLDGSEYPLRIGRDKGLLECLKGNGVVVAFGQSDDIMEFQGVIIDEVYAFDGTTITVTTEGLLPSYDDLDVSDERKAEDYFRQKSLPKSKIEAIWNPKDENGNVYASWAYKTDIPHETFDIHEDGELYCRGIVFKLEDVGKS